ncbi:purine-binding chemotaxis protein CheW [Maridesulfovibrio ferrireducens]|uniref:Purine-binding chemotaxis protein CheW n=1 Tax=Maridesulfovibrio ferrireducens TaxID=246191 RepID=A0A1G9JT48_9BACT|nr:chemotaxis protein CheW [Maridesulfovibrio ferrireducens]SDL40718.1 purine-binding chemotaxis protein CheW [Maridesulfovibrio ferrireducens]
MKTPEEYFVENVNLPGEEKQQDSYTDAESAFMDKYLGLGNREVLDELKRVDPRRDSSLPGFMPAPEINDFGGEGSAEGFEESLKETEEVQLVSFVVGEREYALPIVVIQEVVKKIPITLLPSAPSYMQGIINLRGRVTPVLDLRNLLHKGVGVSDKFVVVCRHKGLQLGLAISAVKTMYRAEKHQLVWGVESEIGVSAEFLLGLYKSGDKLVSILSVDRLVEQILKSEGEGHA